MPWQVAIFQILNPHTMLQEKTSTVVNFEDTASAFAGMANDELRKSLLLFKAMNQPLLVKAGMEAIQRHMRLPWVQRLAEETLYRQFCGGESLAACMPGVLKLQESGVASYLSYSVEGKEEQTGFDRAWVETMRNIDLAARSRALPFVVFKVTALGSTRLLEKMQRGETLKDHEQEAWLQLYSRVEQICLRAYEQDVKLLIDAGESWLQEPVNDLAEQMMQQFNRQGPVIYITLQMYRKDGLKMLQETFRKSWKNRYFPGIKLVRGAYMQKERARAIKLRLPDPLHETREATDEMYNRAVEFCLVHMNSLGLVLGTHNEKSCQWALQLMKRYNIAPDNPNLYLAQLYGMGNHISLNLGLKGYNALKCVAYGPAEEAIPYLIRRAEENSSLACQTSREYSLQRQELNRRMRLL